MINQLNISKRLGLLIAISMGILLATIAYSIYNLKKEEGLSDQLVRSVEQNTKLSWIAGSIQNDLTGLVRQVENNQIESSAAVKQLAYIRNEISNDWKSYTTGLNKAEKEYVDTVLSPEYPGVESALAGLERALKNQSSIGFENYIMNDFESKMQPFVNAIQASRTEENLRSEGLSKSIQEVQTTALKRQSVIAAIGLTLLALLSAVIARTITRPIDVLTETVEGISAGENDRRTNLKGTDELHQLGRALDGLLDDRVSSLVSAQSENDELNDSVMELLEGVSDLSERNLTVSIPVRPDITGTVADAINNMTEQTASVLNLVDEVANDVGKASEAVDQRANTVTKVASAQREVIEDTMGMLDRVSESMETVSEIAAQCNNDADRASGMTDNAMETVQNTVKGMNEIRDMIQETGKRMKRLGERSNEISEVVDIINAIAERTHVLALNASMQAASAGEAGRGFAVVAEEVQKLAESARESTAEISSLVRNIQVDTSDTISTMDQTIANVVEGTKLAEAAGKTMTETREVTNNLVSSINRIAKTSVEQVEVSKGIQEQVSVVVERTRLTVEHLLGQLKQTKMLRGHSQKLVEAVSMFKLPKSSSGETKSDVQEAA